MTSKKKINLIFTVIIVLVSSVLILLSDDSSKLTGSFVDPTPTQIPSDTENTLGVFATRAPVITPISEDPNDDEIESRDGYEVIKVVDGDTMDVNIDGKIERLRLIGIDTPETVDPRKDVQCFGIEASNKAKELLVGKFVTLESDDTQSVRDKYKRLLVYVFVDGINFNKFMIQEGYAYEYTYDSVYKYQSEFKEAQLSAQSSNKGLWNPSTCSGVR